MNFLALSTAQALALAGLTAGVVVYLFFLKLRHRRVVVGSSLLWNRVLDERLANSLVERLRRLVSLLLALTIALLIALAVGKPYVDGSGSLERPVIVVLDTSPSMGARGGSGRTRWTGATGRALGILSEAMGARPVLVADTAGRVQTLVTTDSGAVDRALDEMRPVPGPQRFPALPAGEADVYFITDGVSMLDVPSSVTEISVFEPADNVAVTAFDVRVDPTSASGYRAFLGVVNYAARAKEVAALLSGAGDQRQAWYLEIGPGETWQEDLDLTGFRGGGLRLRIEAEGDGLGLDDTAYAYLPPRNSIRVDLVTAEAGGYLETLLGLSPRVDLTIVRPPDFEEKPEVDVYVFDGFAPPTAPRSPSVVFGAADVDWLPPAAGAASGQAITSPDPEHPVMQHVPVYDVAVAEAAVFEPADWTVVAESDTTPLVAVRDSPVRRVFVGFRPNRSDFPLHLGFPIFMENVLAWGSGEGLAGQAALGYVRIPAEAGEVMTLDGTVVPSRTEFGATVIEAPEPGLFTATVAGRRVRVAANLLDHSVSNVNGTRMTAGESETFPAAGPKELWWYMLLAASLLVALEWWTYHRRITL